MKEDAIAKLARRMPAAVESPLPADLVARITPLSPPLRSPQQRPQGHSAKSKFLAVIFYAAYRKGNQSKGEDPNRDYDGKIWRAVSLTKGHEGIAGPYRDVDIILRPGENSDPWEGQQGTASFFPYLVEDTWYAFYGSH